MLKIITAAAIVAIVCVVAQNNHHPPNHHPHPDGPVACTDAGDCVGCGVNYTASCVEGTCYCTSVVRRAAGAICHNDHECEAGCPSGSHGKCQAHADGTKRCECQSTGK